MCPRREYRCRRPTISRMSGAWATEVSIGGVGALGLGKPDFSRRVDISVREEARQLVASDRIAHVEVGAKVIGVAYWNDFGERDPFAPFRVGCRRGIDADIACDERRIERTEPVLHLQASDDIGIAIAVRAERGCGSCSQGCS